MNTVWPVAVVSRQPGTRQRTRTDETPGVTVRIVARVQPCPATTAETDDGTVPIPAVDSPPL